MRALRELLPDAKCAQSEAVLNNAAKTSMIIRGIGARDQTEPGMTAAFMPLSASASRDPSHKPEQAPEAGIAPPTHNRTVRTVSDVNRCALDSMLKTALVYGDTTLEPHQALRFYCSYIPMATTVLAKPQLGPQFADNTTLLSAFVVDEANEAAQQPPSHGAVKPAVHRGSRRG